MLDAMPQLEALCIQRTISNRNLMVISDIPSLPTPTIPRLSLLSIRDCQPLTSLSLSSYIKAPPTLRRHFFWKDEFREWPNWTGTLKALQPFIPGDSKLGANDGGLRIAQICGHECGSFEMWSRTYSESASTAAREDALLLLHVEWFSKSNGPFNTGFSNVPLLFTVPAYIEDLTITLETITGGGGTASMSETEALIPVERWTKLLTNKPFVRTLRLLRGCYGCVSVLRALSASEDTILPHLQRVIIVNFAIFSAHPDGSEASAGWSVIRSKFVQANVGAELMEVVRGRSGLEVVLAGCEVDDETLDALRERARVYVMHERVYL
ncbi:hypothetical protein EI94DRAFT_1325615 [Lactarius quietus]|nr:hypothetical protein EI94DRAFT_1325615 [Lactarius quietus]